MKLSLKGLTITVAILWGGTIFFCAAINALSPPYAGSFLRVVDSIYPGYHAGRGALSILWGTLYGFFDGALAGFLFALIYNRFARR